MTRRKKVQSLEQKLKAIIVRIPITTDSITAALFLIGQIIELANVVKIPLEVEKVATLETVTVTPPAPIGPVAAETKAPMVEEQK